MQGFLAFPKRIGRESDEKERQQGMVGASILQEEGLEVLAAYVQN